LSDTVLSFVTSEASDDKELEKKSIYKFHAVGHVSRATSYLSLSKD
jgi:hypothetical protein